eukprot:scaffold2477_cov95-Isochrysis_galbana.AAC.9
MAPVDLGATAAKNSNAHINDDYDADAPPGRPPGTPDTGIISNLPRGLHPLPRPFRGRGVPGHVGNFRRTYAHGPATSIGFEHRGECREPAGGKPADA